MNIILIGLRASGKTSAGPELAGRLGWSFTDLDDLVARAMGAGSPGEAFAAHGQAAFRQMEGRLLGDVVKPDRQVIALGGGTPTGMLALETLRRLKEQQRARLVYLRGTPATLRARLAATDLSGRPTVTGAGVVEEVDALFAARDPLYSDLADDIVTIDGKSPEAVVDELFAIAVR